MKRSLLCSLFILIASITYGQDRVKGSKVVINVSESLSTFKRLSVTDGLEVTLLQSDMLGYDLEMDDNLVELIRMDVRDSLLTVSLSKTIKRSKKLNITIRFNELQEIKVDAKARVYSQSIIETSRFKGIILGNGLLEAEIKAPQCSFSINESSKLVLDFRGDDLTINATDNAFANGDINTETISITASGRSDIDFKGNAQRMAIALDETADFKAKSLDVDEVNVNLRGSSKTDLNVDKEIIIDVSDKSMLNLYGSPKITIERFSGQATLQKRD